jgi:hypothetical protein
MFCKEILSGFGDISNLLKMARQHCMSKPISETNAPIEMKQTPFERELLN